MKKNDKDQKEIAADNKAITVDIDDLREIVGGALTNVTLAANSTIASTIDIGAAKSLPSANGTAMCWYSAASPDAVDDWVVIKEKI